LAAATAEQVERIRAAETTRLVAQAELRALQAQIHPHFLFNALNTLYGIIPREAAPARKTVLHLADIFRYFLRSDKAFVPLEEEMSIVNAYLAIESQRLGPKLKIEIQVDPALVREPIPVLSIEPLVENAVKHGVAASTTGGSVKIEITRETDSMRVSVLDTGPGFDQGKSKSGGVGLENVTRRLQLCYGASSEIVVDHLPAGTRVSFRAPCGVQALAPV
jgi:two-component system sensor histidine kinase LytS